MHAHVVEDRVGVEVEPLGDRADPLGAEGALGVDVRDLRSKRSPSDVSLLSIRKTARRRAEPKDCAHLTLEAFVGKHARDAQGVRNLGLQPHRRAAGQRG